MNPLMFAGFVMIVAALLCKGLQRLTANRKEQREHERWMFVLGEPKV
jgi:hypothetical protein